MRPTSLLRAGRSAWKGLSLLPVPHTCSLSTGPYFVAFPNLKEALENSLPIKTQARSCTILPNFVGYVSLSSPKPRLNVPSIKFLVHNGKDYIPVVVTEDMVGYKLGQFSHTRKNFSYKASKK
jgi:ribosomal protein S19